jgi:hypothetical protein
MARSFDQHVRFSGSFGTVLKMLVVIGFVGVIVFYLSPLSPQPNNLLTEAFLANPYLNGLILGVLGLGVIYFLNQATEVDPAIGWIKRVRNSVDSAHTVVPRAPKIISTAAFVLHESQWPQRPLTPSQKTSILDSLSLRIDERADIGRYITNVLVFLGLLGTFWGLLGTVSGVADVISSLAASGEEGSASDAVAQLISNLKGPLDGMSTAFSSSLFGLGGSLVLGILALFAGQAQNQLYTSLEDWLSLQTNDNAGGAPVAEGGKAHYSAAEIDHTLQRLEEAISRLASAQHEGAGAVQQEIRQLGRTLLEGSRSGRS